MLLLISSGSRERRGLLYRSLLSVSWIGTSSMSMREREHEEREHR
jgi:hypothetical protein